MKCEVCDHSTNIIDTRIRPNGGTWRKRECPKCGHRFNTVEVRYEYGPTGTRRTHRKDKG